MLHSNPERYKSCFGVKFDAFLCAVGAFYTGARTNRFSTQERDWRIVLLVINQPDLVCTISL